MNSARRRFAGLAMFALYAASPAFSQSGVTYEGIAYPYPVPTSL